MGPIRVQPENNSGFRIAGFKPKKLNGGWNDEASVRAPFDSLEFAETIKMKKKFIGSELNLPTSVIKFTITSILYVKMLYLVVHNNNKIK